MVGYHMTEQEFDELEMKDRYGEKMTAVESFLLRKEREIQQRRMNPLEELAAAYRRNPWTGEE